MIDSSDSEVEIHYADVHDEDDEELPFQEGSDNEDFVGISSDFRWSTKEPTVLERNEFKESEVGFQTDFSKINSPKNALLQYLDSSTIEMICKFTNAEAASRETNFHPLDTVEFLGWISILVRAGETHQNRTNINVLWTSDAVYGQPFFPTVMSRTRYQQIFKYIR